VHVRDATTAELDELTRIARAAKAHWGYPVQWLDAWEPELTYDARTLDEHDVFVVERAGRIAGVGSLSRDGDTAEIEGLWVAPDAMGHGVGRVLFDECVRRAKTAGATTLIIDSDPHAVGFYERMGAVRVGAVPTAIEGRALPRLRLRWRRDAGP